MSLPGKHAAAFAKAERILASSAASKLLQVAFQPPLRKQPKDGRNAAETTLVPAGLDMVGAIKFGVQMAMPEFDKSVDTVHSCHP